VEGLQASASKFNFNTALWIFGYVVFPHSSITYLLITFPISDNPYVNQAILIFRIPALVGKYARSYLNDLAFMEIHMAKLQPAATGCDCV